MTLDPQVATIVAALATAGVLALLRLMSPEVRWSRRLSQDVTITAGLTDSDEREAWEASVSRQARRLRLYREHVPTWHKSAHWVLVGLLTFMGIDLLLHPESFALMVADGPVMLGIFALALCFIGWVLWAGVSGRDLLGRTAEKRATASVRREVSESA